MESKLVSPFLRQFISLLVVGISIDFIKDNFGDGGVGLCSFDGISVIYLRQLLIFKTLGLIFIQQPQIIIVVISVSDKKCITSLRSTLRCKVR